MTEYPDTTINRFLPKGVRLVDVFMEYTEQVEISGFGMYLETKYPREVMVWRTWRRLTDGK